MAQHEMGGHSVTRLWQALEWSLQDWIYQHITNVFLLSIVNLCTFSVCTESRPTTAVFAGFYFQRYVYLCILLSAKV